MKALQVENLHKTFKDFQALNGIEFSIDAGQCLGLLGTNGAGKSTTIKIITGQISATSGQVKIFGYSPDKNLKEVHALIGLVPEGQSLYEEISVFENIDFFRGIHDLPKEKTFEILNRLDLEDKSKTKVKDLSKGLRQRVLIARAIIHAPKLLLLDEPTSGLDPGSSENIYKVLNELKSKGATILLTTHLMNDVERLCDQIVFINKGLVVAQGSPQELKDRYRKNEMHVISQNIHSHEKRNHLISMDKDHLQELVTISETDRIISIKTDEPKLEDIFIHLTEELA